MKITMLAIGSRGDVQPLVALGLGLKSNGHDVRVATHAIFEGLIRSHGLGFFLIKADPKKTLESRAGQEALRNGSNPFKSWINFSRMVRPSFIQTGLDCLNACEGFDLIVYSPFSTFFALQVSEKLNIPTIAAYLSPMHPTKQLPSLLSPTQRNLGGMFNLFTWKIYDFMTYPLNRSVINELRRKHLGLPPLGITYFPKRQNDQGLVLYGISPSVFPKPADWGENIKVTGYWFLENETGWSPPVELVEFLARGKPPVYVGFGSMTLHDPQSVTAMVLKALKLSNQRGVLLNGWGCLGGTDLPDSVIKIDSAPHGWLFPRMAAVVHHGGAGTTASVLRAGKPSVIVPFFVDQPFWGRRVSELGVGTKPIPFKKLTAERLAKSINIAVNSAEIQEHATELSEKIRTEKGVANAVEQIENLLSQLR
ncbi:MAG: glycosyltransferase [Thermodesulfobacteriota bacterium]